MSTKFITVASMKGGVGKTPSVQEIGLGLAQKKKKKVLLCDMDPQANLTGTFKVKGLLTDTQIKEGNAWHFLSDERDAEHCIYQTGASLYVMPSTLKLALVKEDPSKMNLGILEVRANLENLGFDYIVFDTPPGLQYSLKASLYPADLIISPTDGSHDSIEGFLYIAEILDLLFRNSQIKLSRPEQLLLISNVGRNEENSVRADLQRGFELNGSMRQIPALTTTLFRNKMYYNVIKKRKDFLNPSRSPLEKEVWSAFQNLAGELAA